VHPVDDPAASMARTGRSRAEVPTNRPVACHIVFRQSRDEASIYFRTGF
jgi:hypothetical protein